MADLVEDPKEPVAEVAPVAEAPTDVAPVAEAPVAPTDVAPTPAPAPPAESLPTAGTVDVPAPPRDMLQGPTTPQGTAAYLRKASADWAQDLQNQHITPLTYNKLYEDKSTPGKIMTLFGIMMGGIGSGLTGQANGALEMMDKVIQNDLQAQMKSKDNAQNFLRLNQEHQFQEFQKGLYGAQTDLANAQAKNVAFSTAHQQANIAGLHTIQTKIVQPLIDAAAADPTNMAKKKQAESAQTAFGLVAQGMDAANSNVIDKAQAISGLINANNPQATAAEQSNDNSGVDVKGIQQLINAHKYNSEIGFDPQQAAHANEEAKLVQGNRKIYDNWLKAFKTLDDKKLAGHLNPSDRDAFIAPIKDQIAKQYNLGQDAANELANSLFPSYKDWGASRRDKLEQGYEHFKSLEVVPTLEPAGLYRPLKKPTLTETPAKKFSEGQTGRDPSGKPVIFKNGIWVKQ